MDITDLDVAAGQAAADKLLSRRIAAVPPSLLATRIKGARGKRTQAEVASKAGVSAPFLSKLENGKERPGGETLRSLAEATGRDVEEFLRLDEGDPFSERSTENSSWTPSSLFSDASRSAR